MTVTGSVTGRLEVTPPVMDELIGVDDEFDESPITEGDLFIVEEGTPDTAVLPGIPVGCCPLRSDVGPMRQ